MASIIEQILSKGFRSPNLTNSGPSDTQTYWDVRGYWLQPLMSEGFLGIHLPFTATILIKLSQVLYHILL